MRQPDHGVPRHATVDVRLNLDGEGVNAVRGATPDVAQHVVGFDVNVSGMTGASQTR
jgi:hypothetical protein